MPKTLRRAIAASTMGNLFAWYDFALFGYFASVFGKLFFPSSDPATELLFSFGTFAGGFLARPLGGLIFGHIGDHWGRKKALILTIFLMAFPTTLIGVLPTYAEWGSWAAVTLIGMRLLQGIAMGGNYGGSITFATEHSAHHRRGLIGSFTMTSCLLGFLLGSTVATLCSSFLSDEQLYTWGWRVPFLMGMVICFVGLYMRKWVEESPEYLEGKKAGIILHSPLKKVFTIYGKLVTIVTLIMMLHDVSFYLLFVYMATYLSDVLGLAKEAAFMINTINLFIVALAIIGSAWLSDKIGRRPVMIASALIFIVATIPLLTLIIHSHNTSLVLFCQMILALAVGGYLGPLPVLMSELYPVQIRYSAIAITTNVSGTIFGGASPLFVTYLIKVTGSNMMPGIYLVVAAVISLLALRSVHLKTAHGHA